MKYVSIFLILLFSTGAWSSAQSAFSEIRPLLVQIKTSASSGIDKKSYGTAFVVDRRGLLITNYHVVADSIWSTKSQKLFTEIDGKVVPVSIKAVDFVNDLALISVEHTFPSEIVLSKKTPERGSEVYSLGLPEDVDWTVVHGVYNGIIHQGPYELVHMSSPINSGMSGGPTVNDKNELISVNVSSIKDSQQISFSVPGKYVKLLLDKYKKNKEKEDYLVELNKQLVVLQDEMTNEIIEGFSSPKLSSGLRLPSFSKYTRCWGDNDNASDDIRYTYQGEYCFLSQSVALAGSQYTGTYVVATNVVKNLSLTSIAWTEKKSTRWNYLQGAVGFYDKNQKINFEKMNCRRERVAHTKENPRTIRVCMQKMTQMDDLYDSYIKLMIPINKKQFIHLDINVSGFTKANIKKIVEAAIQHNYIYAEVKI